MASSTTDPSTATGAARTDTEATTPQQTSGITPSSLQSSLTTALNATHVEITDMSGGCGQMYEAVVVSEMFEGKNRLARHRMVNKAVKEQVAVIHAWTPRCLTLGEWEGEKGKGKAGS